MISSSGRGLYTVMEAAQLLGIGRSTMYDLVRRGEVSSLRLGRRVLITRPTLEALLGYEPPTPAELASKSSRTLTTPGDAVAGPARTEMRVRGCVDGRAHRR